MRDLISRQAAINAFEPDHPVDWYATMIVDVLEDLPSAEPERKKGKWIDATVGEMPIQACDQCYTFFPLAYTGGGHNFCPNCGADMRGDSDE